MQYNLNVLKQVLMKMNFVDIIISHHGDPHYLLKDTGCDIAH